MIYRRRSTDLYQPQYTAMEAMVDVLRLLPVGGSRNRVAFRAGTRDGNASQF